MLALPTIAALSSLPCPQPYASACNGKVCATPAGLVTAEQLGLLLGDCGSSLDGCRVYEEFDKFDLEHTGKIGYEMLCESLCSTRSKPYQFPAAFVSMRLLSLAAPKGVNA